jgi:5-formyltetrahydrofolate cyclo-ligase
MCDPDSKNGPTFYSPTCFLHELASAQDGMWGTSPGEQRANILRWRKSERERLIATRLSLPAERRAEHSIGIADNLDRLLPSLSGKVVSLYWPLRGEPDLRGWLGRILERGAICALPVVARKHAPLVFHLWRPGEELVRGFWNIPVPAKEEAVTPDIALAPFVGYDEESYRLGYGGGYFDRTLAVLPPSRQVIGVGYSAFAIRTIYPLAHDIRMDAIVTESGIRNFPGSAEAT